MSDKQDLKTLNRICGLIIAVLKKHQDDGLRQYPKDYVALEVESRYRGKYGKDSVPTNFGQLFSEAAQRLVDLGRIAPATITFESSFLSLKDQQITAVDLEDEPIEKKEWSFDDLVKRIIEIVDEKEGKIVSHEDLLKALRQWFKETFGEDPPDYFDEQTFVFACVEAQETGRIIPVEHVAIVGFHAPDDLIEYDRARRKERQRRRHD